MIIKGFGDTTTPIMHIGTIIWRILDDNDVQRTIRIPNSFHVPTAKVRLLSPQHWAQESNDNLPNPRGTWCATYNDEVIFYWDQQSKSKNIKIDRRKSNTAILWSAPEVSKFRAFVNELIENGVNNTCFASEIERRNHPPTIQ
jgi:hypothetical protein